MFVQKNYEFLSKYFRITFTAYDKYFFNFHNVGKIIINPKPGFLNLDTIDILYSVILCGGGLSCTL